MSDDSATSEANDSTGKAFRQKPTKSLPTDRLSFEKQTLILRGVAKASLANSRGAVTNNEVATYAQVAATSVSLCNVFWVEAGLLTREGNKVRPVDAVFEYDQAADWASDSSGTKLADVLSAAWFGKAMTTKLSIIPTTSMDDAISFLATQCQAPPEYKAQLSLLLDYLNFAGVINVDGNVIKRVQKDVELSPPPSAPKQENPGGITSNNANGTPAQERAPLKQQGMKVITIALPDKDSVTVEIPESFEADDWILVAEQLVGYIKRWKKYQAPSILKSAIDDPQDTSAGGLV